MQKVTLNTWDRATLLAVLSQQRGLPWPKLHKMGKLYDALDFTEAEAEEAGMTVGDNGALSWQTICEYELEFPDRLFKLLATTVDEFDGWLVQSAKLVEALREKLGLDIDDLD